MRFCKRVVWAVMMAGPVCSWAQQYPSKPVRVVVPFSPGGATDIVTRVVAQRLNDLWAQSVVVDNRAGAGGNIGGDIVAKAAPDGYTVLMTSGSIVAANPHMYKKMPFSPARDLVAVTNVASGPQIIAVNAGFAAKTLKDLIDLARTKPKSLTFGSAGIGTQTHLAAESFASAAGIDVTHIPYKGEGPALIDLLAGQIQFVTPNLSAAIGFVQQGKLRGLAVTSKVRAKQLPDVPAVADTLPGFENLGWFGFVAPAGTPKAVIDKLHKDTAKVLQSAEVRGRFEQLGMVPVGNTPEEFARAIGDESARWGKIIRDRKLYVE
jgi:tripartite-type tricarboxylate transporter receptor subunit TctC